MIDLTALTNMYEKPEITAQFGDKLHFDHPMAPLTTFNTGGNAKYFISLSRAEQAKAVISKARELKLPFIIIGGGSNLLVSDDGYDGLVIKIDVKGLELFDNTYIRCGAGEELMDLVNFAADNSLTGLEFASGIFGFVGGAIFGNAGAYGGEIKDVLTELTILNQNSELEKVTPDYCQFDYRHSSLKKSGDIIVEAVFNLKIGEKEFIRNKVDEILTIRAAKHPVKGKCAGSFFKNIPDSSQPHGKLPAGKLLEEAGVKGMEIGGAKVYEKHANIIINTGLATSKDIRLLADMMKEKVMNKFNIELEEEVISIGNF